MSRRARAGQGVYGVKLFDFDRPSGSSSSSSLSSTSEGTGQWQWQWQWQWVERHGVDHGRYHAVSASAKADAIQHIASVVRVPR